MALVERAPLINYREKQNKGVVRYVTKKGISVEFDSESRPVGISAGMPDVNRAEKEVYPGDREAFNNGKSINRSSVYAPYNSGYASGWSGPRSRTK